MTLGSKNDGSVNSQPPRKRVRTTNGDVTAMHSIRAEVTDTGLINITANAVITTGELEKFTTAIARVATASQVQEDTDE